MLKKLRLRITLTIMAMATVVFAVAFFILCTTIWNTSASTFISELEEAVKHGPTVSVNFSIGGWNPNFDAPQDDSGADDGSTQDGGGSGQMRQRGSFTPIAIITYDSQAGTIVQYNADYTAMSQSVRTEAIARTLAMENGSGIYTDLGLFWCIHSDKDGELTMAFADANAFLSSMKGTVAGILCVSSPDPSSAPGTSRPSSSPMRRTSSRPRSPSCSPTPTSSPPTPRRRWPTN